MISLTKLNGKTFFVNPHQIESMEENPDLTLVMLSGKRLVVQEDYRSVLNLIVNYRKRIGAFKNEE